jgi:hypothetical protein
MNVLNVRRAKTPKHLQKAFGSLGWLLFPIIEHNIQDQLIPHSSVFRPSGVVLTKSSIQMHISSLIHSEVTVQVTVKTIYYMVIMVCYIFPIYYRCEGRKKRWRGDIGATR